MIHSPDELEVTVLTGMRRTWLVGFGFGVGRTSDIAQSLHTDNRKALRILRRMEKRGLVELLPSRSDAYWGYMWAETAESAAAAAAALGTTSRTSEGSRKAQCSMTRSSCPQQSP